MSDIVGKIGYVLLLVGFALAMIGLLTMFVGYALEDLL